MKLSTEKIPPLRWKNCIEETTRCGNCVPVQLRSQRNLEQRLFFCFVFSLLLPVNTESAFFVETTESLKRKTLNAAKAPRSERKTAPPWNQEDLTQLRAPVWVEVGRGAGGRTNPVHLKGPRSKVKRRLMARKRTASMPMSVFVF